MNGSLELSTYWLLDLHSSLVSMRRREWMKWMAVRRRRVKKTGTQMCVTPSGEEGKVSPLWVNCEREERCMVGLGEVAVDAVGMRARRG